MGAERRLTALSTPAVQPCEHSGCALEVPAGESDAMKVIATLEDRVSKASFKGLSVYIRD